MTQAKSDEVFGQVMQLVSREFAGWEMLDRPNYHRMQKNYRIKKRKHVKEFHVKDSGPLAVDV